MSYTQHIEDEMIDELTGEIIELDQTDNIVVEDLPKIVRILGALDKKQDHIERYIKGEVARLVDYCNNETRSIQAERTKFEGIGETLLRQTGEKKKSYPGLGSVRIGLTRESVDTTGYDELSIDDQKIIQELRQDFFRTKITVSPDKKSIMAMLKEKGNTEHFTIRPKQETFIFKAE